jgi:hypothetical protein
MISATSSLTPSHQTISTIIDDQLLTFSLAISQFAFKMNTVSYSGYFNIQMLKQSLLLAHSSLVSSYGSSLPSTNLYLHPTFYELLAAPISLIISSFFNNTLLILIPSLSILCYCSHMTPHLLVTITTLLEQWNLILYHHSYPL